MAFRAAQNSPEGRRRPAGRGLKTPGVNHSSDPLWRTPGSMGVRGSQVGKYSCWPMLFCSHSGNLPSKLYEGSRYETPHFYFKKFDIEFFMNLDSISLPQKKKSCVCLRPHGRSENFYGDRNWFEVIYVYRLYRRIVYIQSVSKLDRQTLGPGKLYNLRWSIFC